MYIKRHFLPVNNKGFISIYALTILSIFLLFSIMFTQKIITYAYIRKQEYRTFIDLFILKSVQYKLQVNKESEAENQEEKHIQEEANEPLEEEDKTDPLTWEAEYEHITFHFKLDKQQIRVTYLLDDTSKEVDIQLSEEQSILDYAYVSP